MILGIEKCSRLYAPCLAYIWYDGSTLGEGSEQAIQDLRDTGLLYGETITGKGLI